MEKKTSVLAVLEILQRESDRDHPLTAAQIQQKMEQLYQCPIERRTLYANIQMLKEFGYEISTYQENGHGYYLDNRDFEESEIMLLCNAVHASNFIPRKHSNDLIKKLLATQSHYTAQKYRNMVYIDNLRKKDNQDFFFSLQILLEAVEEKCAVEFDYVQYNEKLQLVPRRTAPYVVQPVYLVYENEKTYLIARHEKYRDFSHYRVDKIRNIQKREALKEPLGPLCDPYEYAKTKVYMYGGEVLDFILLCHRRILDDIVDHFGREIQIVMQDPEHFITRVKGSREGVIYLAMQYAKWMEILEPASVREEMKTIFSAALSRYEKK